MIKKYGFSKARSNLTELMDRAQSNKPSFIKQRKASEDDAIIINKKLLYTAYKDMARKQFKTKIIKEDNSDTVSIWLDPFNIYGMSKFSLEEAINDLLDETTEYANEYIEDINIYLNSSNRRLHLPLVIQVLLCEDNQEELRELINAKME